MKKNYTFTEFEYDRIKSDLEFAIKECVNVKGPDFELILRVLKQIYGELLRDTTYKQTNINKFNRDHPSN